MKKVLCLFFAIFAFIDLKAQWSGDNWTSFEVAGLEPQSVIFDMSVVNDQVVWLSYYVSSIPTTQFSVTSNGGESFFVSCIISDIGKSADYQIGSICGIDENTAYAAVYKSYGEQTDVCGIYKTTNGGVSWTNTGVLSGNGFGVFANNVFFWDLENGFCNGDVDELNHFKVYTTNNGGDTWQPAVTPAVESNSVGSFCGNYDGAANGIGGFGATNGNVYITTDFGASWNAYNTGLETVGRISFANADTLIATFDNLEVTRSADGGISWEMLPVVPQTFFDVTFPKYTDANTLTVAGIDAIENVNTCITANGGVEWFDITQYN